MQLSKREFQKLSKKDQQMLASKKPANNSRQKKKTVKRGPQTVKSGSLSTAPVSMARQNKMSKPRIQSHKNGDCEIRHREYLKDINAEGTSPSIFTSEDFPINPGMLKTFPWLAQIAPRFEKYHFKMLKFCFETEAPTSLGGSLILTVDYDASDPAPQSKVQAMAYKNAVRSAPWEECTHTSAKEDLSQQKQYFVRSEALNPNSDIKLYDVGNLFVCSQNVVTGGATLGELYVDYHILLETPQLQPAVVVDPLFGGSSGSNGGESGANPMGTTPVTLPASRGFTLDNASVLTFTHLGWYTLLAQYVGTVITATSFTQGAGISAYASSALIDGGGLNVTSSLNFEVTSLVNATIALTATATTITSGSIQIGQAPAASLP